MHTFQLKTRVCFGSDSLSALSTLKAKSAVIFTDAYMQESGNAQKIADLMTGCERISFFSEITPDPPVELIAHALEFLLETGADVAVALGGGSSIDAAKSTLLMYEKKTDRTIPLIAIPTTSGTGSEVTRFAVVTDLQEGMKYPLVSDKLLPDMAILSPEFTVSVPPEITAGTGFDVMTHALEAYISTGANDFTDAFAEKALELALAYLPICCKNGRDTVAREKMHTASCLAGMAFNDAGLGVNHGIAHALGAAFHIPHGRANGLVLYHVMRYNAAIDEGLWSTVTPTCERLARIARYAGLPAPSASQGAMNLLNRIKFMTRELGIPQTLGEAGVDEHDYLKAKAYIIEHAVEDACTATNPRKITPDSVEQILQGIEKF